MNYLEINSNWFNKIHEVLDNKIYAVESDVTKETLVSITCIGHLVVYSYPD